MLQEATKLLSAAFKDSFIKRICLYLHDCVREEVKSSTFRNLNQDKENKWFFLSGEEMLLSNPDGPLSLDGTNSLITELMLQAEISQKDRYLIYGYFFLAGKNAGRKRTEEFLTPLLYSPCKLERSGVNINCTLTEDTLSLNTGALASLLKYDDEDRVDHIFEGLIDVVPDLPITNEKLQIFFTTLKSIIPDIEISMFNHESPFVPDTNGKLTVDKLSVVDISAIVLTKRPTITAGVLHELTQISEKPSGIFRETVLNTIQEEYSKNQKSKNQAPMSFDPKKNKKDEIFFPITPLELSDSQTQVIDAIRQHPLVSVFGPPGTGKSQTIVNLVSHLVASGKTVLVVSRMDKAVDVISERLNNLGAPFLCLRAGRQSYQKQLNFYLQDLLANKVDLDSGFESSVFASLDDMKNLVKSIKELENKCEKILQFEKDWYIALNKYEEQKKSSKAKHLITSDFTEKEIEQAKILFDKIRRTYEKSGFFNSIITKLSYKKLMKNLHLNKIELTCINLDKIEQDLEVIKLKNVMKIIEGSISKTGNLNQLLESLKKLRERQKELSADILKNQRRESLKGLMRDQAKRQNLYIHSKALVERKKNLQNRLLHQEDFKPLLEAFPCWATTTYEISECLPLKPGMFDVVIVDEASQCDIASCIPALFRAKSAVIVGDDKQLSHLSFLEKAKEQSFLSQYNIPDRYQLILRFRSNSIFDLANFYSSRSVLLDEHFRSYPPIINFSNQEFYGNRIKIISKELEIPDCIELNIVDDAKVDLDTTRNMAEVEKIMEKLQDIILNDSKNMSGQPHSIGIISPFRGQVELIKKAISQVLTGDIVKKHQLEVGTAHTFQGDEKDIILLSFTIAPNSHFQSLIFIQKPNLFNVAITRARKKLICFISRSPESLQSGLLRNYLEYIQAYKLKTEKKEMRVIYNNSAEETAATSLRQEGFSVYPDFEFAGFKLDMVVSNGENSVAVEFNGFDETENQSKEIKNQAILERCGWKVMRITAREWHYSSKICINRIKESL
ncbi:MAG: AAA domain-containing protein [Candidatus Gastranaerophilales bacterium]|nr:AAA domain-containing protein [Candidatus Gastranaerophilales bacterium]